MIYSRIPRYATSNGTGVDVLKTAIVGLGWWGQVLVDAVQVEGKPKDDKIHF